MLGTVVKDPHLLEDVPARITNKLTGNLSALAYSKARGGDWDLSGHLQKAVEAYHRFRAPSGGGLSDRARPSSWLRGGSGGDVDQIAADVRAIRSMTTRPPNNYSNGSSPTT